MPFDHSLTLFPPPSHHFLTSGPIFSRIEYRRMGRVTSSSSRSTHTFLLCAVCRCVDSIVLPQSTCTARAIVLFVLDTTDCLQHHQRHSQVPPSSLLPRYHPYPSLRASLSPRMPRKFHVDSTDRHGCRHQHSPCSSSLFPLSLCGIGIVVDSTSGMFVFARYIGT